MYCIFVYFISFHFFLFKGCNGKTHPVNTTFGYLDWYHNTGFVKSPDYPSNYPHNQVCRWSIQVAPGFRILATVKQADLAHAAQSGGLGDTLQLDDGTSGKTSIEHSAPWEFLSNASLVRIIFITDSANAGKGFYIHYERGMYDMPLHYDLRNRYTPCEYCRLSSLPTARDISREGGLPP